MNALKLPIILSGGQVFPDSGNEARIAKRMLISLGVNPNDIYIEDKSLNTEQNAKFTAILLKKHHFKKPILITSAFHMVRAVQHFRKRRDHGSSLSNRLLTKQHDSLISKPICSFK